MPLLENEIANIMGVTKLNMAAETFVGNNDNWVKSNQIFFLNAQRDQLQKRKARKNNM